MKYKLKFIIVIILLIALNNRLLAQGPVLPVTADSLATGNYKDVLKSFFQLSFDKLTSPNKEIRFTSNPFAVMAKMNPDLLIDTNYINYTHLRNLNFSFAGKLDSAYRFNGFSSGIKYALINNRDETVSRAFITSAFNANNEFNILNDSLEAHIGKINIADPKRKLFRDEKTKMFKGEVGFNELDTSFQRFVKDIADSPKTTRFLKMLDEDPKLNIYKASQQTYDSLKTLFQNKLLWTVGVDDTTYNNQFVFSNVVFSTELLKGIFDPLKPVTSEIGIKGMWDLEDDTLKSGDDLKRSILNIEPSFNLVLKAKKTGYSWAEFKVSGSFYHNFNNLYPGEKRDSLTLNGTLRVRIINDIWIPLEIKYDPRSGNVFGFLNVRANFSALGNILNPKK